MSGYLFHDTIPTTRTDNALMLDALAGMFDPVSRQRLRQSAIPVAARCLVVAVGASCIASTLAEMCHMGEVIATDLELAPARRHPRVHLMRHDIVTDPLPEGGFDLIHIRLLLAHLPAEQREDVLARLVGALNPNGLLIVEEFEATWRPSVLSAPNLDEADRLFNAYHVGFQAALAKAGNDPRWGRHAHHALRIHGLDVTTTGHTGTWTGGSPACLLPHATTGIIRPRDCTRFG
ncbi:class I SAM-dependent methyltransferase [Micromonospora sp. SH-82]|uniref:class I SAM-dependent methyltransferase n=1 Tax=Micromonospora sp. SH-82 TaxID=3132938 RepID=UPI003EB90918